MNILLIISLHTFGYYLSPFSETLYGREMKKAGVLLLFLCWNLLRNKSCLGLVLPIGSFIVREEPTGITLVFYTLSRQRYRLQP